jgi:DNA polymerase-3 subunit alpha
MIVLVFDTETNGLPKNPKEMPNILNCNDWPNVVQFSYLLYDTNAHAIILKKNHIIRVPKDVVITTESIKFHGITNEISEECGIPIEGALNAFYEHFKLAHVIVAHNVEFDKKFVVAEILKLTEKRTDLIYLLGMATNIACSKKYYCTMQEGTDLCKIKAYTKVDKREYNKFPTLTELCKHLFGYEPKNMHNAMNDVIVCFQCFYKMRFDINICEENQDVFEMASSLM